MNDIGMAMKTCTGYREIQIIQLPQTAKILCVLEAYCSLYFFFRAGVVRDSKHGSVSFMMQCMHFLLPGNVQDYCIIC
jgi:hypothetical protein